MRPCTPFMANPGMIGTMLPDAGMMNDKGAGENPSFVSDGCGMVGTIGMIGTNFPAWPTCARARDMAVRLQMVEEFQDSLDAYAEKIIPIIPIVPEVPFMNEDQWVERVAFRLSIIPENQRSSLSSLKNQGQIKMQCRKIR